MTFLSLPVCCHIASGFYFILSIFDAKTNLVACVVLILDGNQETSMHAKNNLCHLICLRHLSRSRAVSNRIFSYKRPIFIYVCATHYELPANTPAKYHHCVQNKTKRILNVISRYNPLDNPNKDKLSIRAKHLTNKERDEQKKIQTDKQRSKYIKK